MPRSFAFLLGTGVYLLFTLVDVAAAGEDAEAVVRGATEEIYQALDAKCELLGEKPEHLYTLVDQLLIPHVDFEKMSQWILGKHWRETGEQQRNVFVKQFRQLLIRTYATAIQLAAPEHIHYLPQRASAKPDRATVRVEIHRPGEPVVSLTYSLYRSKGDWLVYDILVDGISLVSNYRTTFADEIRSHGFTGLLQSLEKKNSEAMTDATARQIRSRLSGRCGR